jgi:hypothetical protein
MTGITIEHSQIMDWTQSRGGRPAIEKSADTTRPVICFSSSADPDLVTWEEWMSVFDGSEWAFIYQDRTPEGELSQNWHTIPRFASESE